VSRSLAVFLCAVAILCSACNRAGENKQAVREGIVQHLSKNAALDVNQLNVDVTDVKFSGNTATAAVSIKPKSAPEQGMNMTYTLERRGDKWEVQGRAAGHGGAGAAMSGGLGSGAAPPAGAAESGTHNETPEPKGALGDAPASGAGVSRALPPGHPPVNPPSAGTK